MINDTLGSRHVMVPPSGKHFRIGVKDQRCVSIEHVERGKRCGCVCGACGHPLVARKGGKRAWHFAHAAGGDCQRMGETHLHLAAKQILQDRKEILLPDYRGKQYGRNSEPDKEYLTESVLWSPLHSDLLDRSKEPVIKGTVVTGDDVRVEEWLDGIRPDIVFEKSGRFLLIEIKVTHATEKPKCIDIYHRGLACMEIDLSATSRDVDLLELERIVTGIGCDSDSAPRKWISCPKGEKKVALHSEQRKQEFSRRIRAAQRKLPVRPAYTMGSDVVERCPINVYKGRQQARIIECIYCKHHVAYFGVEDGSLHVELTGDKGFNVVYCGCTKEIAEAHREAERKKAVSVEEERHGWDIVQHFADLGHDLPSKIAADLERLKIWEIQKKLEEAGHRPGEADGFMGSRTRAALRDFQAARRLTPHGDLDPLTLATLPGLGKKEKL